MTQMLTNSSKVHHLTPWCLVILSAKTPGAFLEKGKHITIECSHWIQWSLDGINQQVFGLHTVFLIAIPDSKSVCLESQALIFLGVFSATMNKAAVKNITLQFLVDKLFILLRYMHRNRIALPWIGIYNTIGNCQWVLQSNYSPTSQG